MKNIETILIVGVGGSGSMLIPALAPAFKLVLADNDTFEEKNFTRQFFANGNIGENKADVLARQFSTASKDVHSHPKLIEGSEDWVEGVDLIIACVDTNQGRKACKKLSDTFMKPLIVAGNENWDPQANLYLPEFEGTEADPFTRLNLGDLEEGVRRTCTGEEIVSEIPQLPIANHAAGGFALSIMYSLMSSKKKQNYLAEVAAQPRPFSKTIKQLITQ